MKTLTLHFEEIFQIVLGLFLVFFLSSCGKEAVLTDAPVLDPNRCPTADYGSIEFINFLDDGSVISDKSGVCEAYGTYSCNAATRSLTLKLTQNQAVDAHLQSNCVALKTYSCSYSYQQVDGLWTRLILSCGADGVKTYETARMD